MYCFSKQNTRDTRIPIYLAIGHTVLHSSRIISWRLAHTGCTRWQAKLIFVSLLLLLLLFIPSSRFFFFFSKVWNRLESNEDDSKESLSKRNRGISILINSVEGEDGIILSRRYLAGCHEAFDTKATDVSDVKVFHTHRRIQWERTGRDRWPR